MIPITHPFRKVREKDGAHAHSLSQTSYFGAQNVAELDTSFQIREGFI